MPNTRFSKKDPHLYCPIPFPSLPDGNGNTKSPFRHSAEGTRYDFPFLCILLFQTRRKFRSAAHIYLHAGIGYASCSSHTRPSGARNADAAPVRPTPCPFTVALYGNGSVLLRGKPSPTSRLLLPIPLRSPWNKRIALLCGALTEGRKSSRDGRTQLTLLILTHRYHLFLFFTTTVYHILSLLSRGNIDFVSLYHFFFCFMFIMNNSGLL